MNLRSKIFRELLKDVIFFGPFVFAVCVNILLWILLFFFFQPSSEFVPLHYNIYFSIDKFGAWYKIFYIPANALAILFINTILALVFYSREKVISYFFLFSSLFIQLIAFFSGSLILINI